MCGSIVAADIPAAIDPCDEVVGSQWVIGSCWFAADPAH
jgi:hypothetical protein